MSLLGTGFQPVNATRLNTETRDSNPEHAAALVGTNSQQPFLLDQHRLSTGITYIVHHWLLCSRRVSTFGSQFQLILLQGCDHDGGE